MHQFQFTYTPGNYGNFIAWCLYSFTELNSENSIIPPWGLHGSAHGFIEKLDRGTAICVNHKVQHSYPVGILLVTDPERLVEYTNNMLYKQFECNLGIALSCHSGFDGKTLAEKLTSYSQWFCQGVLQKNFVDSIVSTTKNNIESQLPVTVDEFFADPVTVIQHMATHVGTKVTDDISKLSGFVDEYLSRQLFLHRNRQLVTAVENWKDSGKVLLPNMTFYDAAWIMAELVQQGFTVDPEVFANLLGH